MPEGATITAPEGAAAAPEAVSPPPEAAAPGATAEPAVA